MIPPPYATVTAHGPGSWTARIGWIDPADGIERDVVGIIYDHEMDPRRREPEPGSDNDGVDPKVVCWAANGDTRNDSPGFPLDSVPDAGMLLDRLTLAPAPEPDPAGDPEPTPTQVAVAAANERDRLALIALRNKLERVGFRHDGVTWLLNATGADAAEILYDYMHAVEAWPTEGWDDEEEFTCPQGGGHPEGCGRKITVKRHTWDDRMDGDGSIGCPHCGLFFDVEPDGPDDGGVQQAWEATHPIKAEPYYDGGRLITPEA